MCPSRSAIATCEPAVPRAKDRNLDLLSAVAEWRAAVGEEDVIQAREVTSQYGSSEIAAKRQILAVIKPTNTDQVAQIVRIAGRYGVPLYPVSTGHNWGYGAASPVKDNCVLVDLSRMNQILDSDEDLGLVTVQPGVTPSQLRDYLDRKHLPYLVPVHGAGPNCSLVGNALERGYGVTPYVDHFGAVMSLEAVLPNGKIYRPALSAGGGAAIDKAFKWGIGPYLDGIFSQGNFAIVTEMTLALAPRPEKVEGFLFGLKKDDDLGDAVETVRDILKSVGNVSGSINLMNPRRVLSMIEEYPRDRVEKGHVMSQALVDELLKKNYLSSWTVAGIMYGDGGILKAAKTIMSKRVRSLARRKLFISRWRIDLAKRVLALMPGAIAKRLKKQLANLDETFNVAEGAPTEMALNLCYWKMGKIPPKGEAMNPAQDGCGVIWYSPLVPMKADRVRVYVDMVTRICLEHRVEPLITLTSISHRCFDSTVPILFDPQDPDETDRAKKCYLALFEAGKQEGFLPYRVGIDHMDLITQSDAPYWNLVAKIKQAIDPDGIIAPGRYCPHIEGDSQDSADGGDSGESA